MILVQVLVSVLVYAKLGTDRSSCSFDEAESQDTQCFNFTETSQVRKCRLTKTSISDGIKCPTNAHTV